MQTAAKILSWLFLPLLIPVYALAVVMFIPSLERNLLQPNSLFMLGFKQKLAIIYLFTLFSFLAPSIVIAFLRLQGFLSSVTMENRKERLLPAAATILSGSVLIYTIYSKISQEMFGFTFLAALSWGSLITVVICTLITLRYKISLHAAGMGILCGFLVSYFASMYFFHLACVVIAFLVSGMVMSARAYLKLHSQRELLFGFAIGFLTLMATCNYLLVNSQS